MAHKFIAHNGTWNRRKEVEMTRPPGYKSPGAGMLPGVIGKVMVSTEEMLTQLIQINVIVSTIRTIIYPVEIKM